MTECQSAAVKGKKESMRKYLMYEVEWAAAIDFGYEGDATRPYRIHLFSVSNAHRPVESCVLLENDTRVDVAMGVMEDRVKHLHHTALERKVLCVSTSEEMKFLKHRCQIPTMLVSEAELWNKTGGQFTIPPVVEASIPSSNCYYRAWRIARLLERFREIFYPRECV